MGSCAWKKLAHDQMYLSYSFNFYYFMVKIHLVIYRKIPQGYRELVQENITIIASSTNMWNSKSRTQLPQQLRFTHLKSRSFQDRGQKKTWLYCFVRTWGSFAPSKNHLHLCLENQQFHIPKSFKFVLLLYLVCITLYQDLIMCFICMKLLKLLVCTYWWSIKPCMKLWFGRT